MKTAHLLDCLSARDDLTPDDVAPLVKASHLGYQDEDGCNALMVACRYAQPLPILRVLLDAGAFRYMHQRNVTGKDVFWTAALYHSLDAIEVLLEYGPTTAANTAFWGMLQHTRGTATHLSEVDLRRELGVTSNDIEVVFRRKDAVCRRLATSFPPCLADIYEVTVLYPRVTLLYKLRRAALNTADPISFDEFDDMSLADLRRIYVIDPDDHRHAQRLSRWFEGPKTVCFHASGLAALAQQGLTQWKHPLTRRPLGMALYRELRGRTTH